MASHAPVPAVSPPASGRWLWFLPALALVLFVASVATQLWLSGRSETEEERATLINDMLWLEQSLRFNLQHNEELLARLGPEQVADARVFEAHARALLDNNSGLRQVLYLGPDGRPLQALPASQPHIDGQTLTLASRLGKPIYSPPYRDPAESGLFQVHVPRFQAGRQVGTVVGVYSLGKMLDDAAPWWLVMRNRIGVEDALGQSLASRSRMGGGEPGHRLFLDPPGHGLVLWMTPIRQPVPAVKRLLSASLVLLAALLVWSLWALRRHLRQQRAAEQALREAHAFRLAMEDSLQTGLRARDLEGRITYVNPAFCRMVGWSAGELVGRAPPMPYWVDDEIGAAQALNDRILSGQGPRQGYQIRLKRRDGSTFPVLIHTTPLINAQGRQTGWMSSIVDLTEEKRAEERARQQQERLQTTSRLVAMGEMASSLAHELNQPLAAIAGYTAGAINMIDTTLKDCQDGRLTEIRGALVKSQEQAQRAGRVIRRIYDFVRRSEPKREPVDITRLIEEVADLVNIDARRHQIRLVRDIAPELPGLQGDRVLLGQALFNLLRNGLEAMLPAAPAGDAATADTCPVPPPGDTLRIRARIEADHLRIDVIDQGYGLSAEATAHLFEPFHTTKAEGMGMGLNICRSIVEAHQGRLWVEANPAGGSVFSLALPLPGKETRSPT